MAGLDEVREGRADGAGTAPPYSAARVEVSRLPGGRREHDEVAVEEPLEIRIGGEPRQVPQWVARRRVAYRLIDAAAETTKRIVRRLVPRPARGVVKRDH